MRRGEEGRGEERGYKTEFLVYGFWACGPGLLNFASCTSSILSFVLDVLEMSSWVLDEVADLTLAERMACFCAASGVSGPAGERRCHERGRRKLRMPSRPNVEPNPECFTPVNSVRCKVKGGGKREKGKGKIYVERRDGKRVRRAPVHGR